ncbi:DUF202 domain-containing protein [Nocardioides bruguierae]|uniref:DUF202 domain-containing protein n=1 Tax=Nocardioides bruguierae TaxID=2945102 RepID=A0A9X2D7D6_9ACTN|nr:DUF202 domain-containing protein [Nocardioides bruguierae]MCL8025016.1 DUF202 domain-containing protein [Nocardioides bruguierae]MCM0620177.1 DUF202 domain-containing protein [Nocardioides bruguierae]
MTDGTGSGTTGPWRDPTVGTAPERAAQHERTALAWQRTGLSVAVAALAAARFAWLEVGPLALVDVVVALSLMGWFVRESRRRHGRRQAGVPAAPAVGPALVAGAVVVLGAVELVAVLRAAAG